MLGVPSSELDFWSKKVGVSSSEVGVPRSEVGVPSKKVGVSRSEGEGWRSELADLNWKAGILSRVAPGLSATIQLETIFNPDAIVKATALLLELNVMVDWLVVWGVAQAAGFVFKPILEDLAKESAKDYAKDFFKDCLKKVIRLPEKDVQKEAYGKALKEFLQFVQQQLEDADYQDAQIKQYIQPLQKFIKQQTIAAALGRAFEADCRGLDIVLLNQTWHRLELPLLPEAFDWEWVSKRYLKKVKAIVGESDKLRPIFEAQSQEIVAEGVQELVGIAPAFDLGRYAEGLREQYGNLKLESLDTTGVYYSELKLWKIFIPQTVRECQEFLPQFYEIPKDQMRRLRQSGQVDEVELAEVELEQHRRVYGEQLPRSILEVVGDPGVAIETNRYSPLRYDGSTQYDGSSQYNDSPVKHAVVLGDPGSGKSTLLQYMALVWAERPLIELSLYPIPLLIELRSYARDQQAGRCRDILTFLHSGNITCRLNQQQLHDKLSVGQAIALFDGIDEVFDPELRDRVVTDIHRFTNDYPAVQVIVTSRWLGYKAQRLRDAGFRHFMLQDLEAEQIETFMQRWHDLTFLEGADKQRKRERLQKAIRDSKAIQELAGNPLLLTMMAILNRNQELPRDRPELYNQASRVLLHQWDVERALVEDARLDPKTIDYRDKQAMLRKVAYHMQSSEKGLAGNIISATDLENILAEYLRAIEVENPRTAARLMINQLRTRNFILCYLGADSYAFVHCTFLEYFCAWEFVWQFKETQTLTLEQLKTEVFGQHWHDEAWHEMMQLISGMIDEKFVGEIIDYLVAQNGEEAKFKNVFLAANCLQELRNYTAITLIEKKIFSCLENLTQFDLNYSYNRFDAEAVLVREIQQDAVHKIVEIWGSNREIFLWLKESSLNHKVWVVRWLSARLLAQWRKEPETLSFLKTCSVSKENWATRQGAVQALIDGWEDTPEILEIFHEVVNSVDDVPDDVNVRAAALRGLSKIGKNDPEIFQLLKTKSISDHEWIRKTAVEELASGWKKIPELFEFLHDRTLHDPYERGTGEYSKYETNPRQTALEAILKNYSDRPQTIELLIDRANNDPDEKLQEFAKQQLAKLEKQK